MEDKILEIIKSGKLNYTAEERTKDIMKIFTETVNDVAVSPCKNHDIWRKYPDKLPTENGDYLITVTYWSQIVGDYIEDEVMLDSFFMGSFSIERRFVEHPVTIKAWAYKPDAYREL